MRTVYMFDMATRAGWAMWRPGLLQPMWGHFDLPGTLPLSELWKVFVHLRNALLEFDKEIAPFSEALVGVEMPIKKQTDDVPKLRRLIGVANETETTAAWLGAEIDPVPHGTMMVHWTGTQHHARRADMTSSEVGKEYSRKAARAKGWETECHDEADALGGLNFLCAKRKIDVPWDTKGCPNPQWLDLTLKQMERAA